MRIYYIYVYFLVGQQSYPPPLQSHELNHPLQSQKPQAAASAGATRAARTCSGRSSSRPGTWK